MHPRAVPFRPVSRWWHKPQFREFCAAWDANRWRGFLPKLAGDQAVNGSFDTDTYWAKGSGWTISGGSAVKAPGVQSSLDTANSFGIAGEAYKIVITITHVAGSLGVFMGGTNFGNLASSGTFELYGVAGALDSGRSALLANATFNGSVQSISYERVSTSKVAGKYLCRPCTFQEFFNFQAANDDEASYFDSGGVFRTAGAVNMPRRTWLNGKQQLRLENASSNLLIRSTDFTLAAWNKNSIAASAYSHPRGVALQELVESASGAALRNVTGITIAAATTYTISCFFVRGNSDWVRLMVADTTAFTGNVSRAWANLATGAVGSTEISGTNTVGTPVLQNYGGGLYRLSFSFTSPSTTCFVGMMTAAGNLSTARADIGGGPGIGTSLIAGSVQLEPNPFATDSIPTTTAAVTRVREDCLFGPMPTALLQRSAASVVVRAEKILADPAVIASARPRLIGTDGNTSLINGGSPATTLQSYNGTTAIGATLVNSANFTQNAFGAAMGFDGTGRSLAGGLTTNSDANLVAGRTQVYLGRSVSSATVNDYANGFYDFIGIAPERLSNSNLQALAVPA